MTERLFLIELNAMFSELSQQLDIKELESFSIAMEFALTAHLRWLSNINHSLVCNIGNSKEYCSGKPFKQCQFGLWYYKIDNQAVLNDQSYKLLGVRHKEMHKIVCELFNEQNKTGRITHGLYKEFADVQNSFFDVLQLLSKDSKEALGNVDFLTGLPNRRAFYQVLNMEQKRIRRKSTKSSVIIADIDYFKRVNDTYGHFAGDKVLTQVAKIFKTRLRDYDTVARLGGEEFIFCLPEADPLVAKVILERIKEDIFQFKFDINSEKFVHITCSFGISHFDHELPAIEALTFADAALYKAKHLGRNKIIIHSP